MTLSERNEFDLIEDFKHLLKQDLPKGTIGIGDDCAVIAQTADQSLLVTADLLVEGIHFLRSSISPKDLGHKSLAVNLSDIAAMGGTPTSAFLSIALPGDLEIAWIQAFFAGFRDLAKSHGVYVLGGDTTRSLRDIVINVTLQGSIQCEAIKLRSSAKIGDSVCVVGTLGESAAGLRMILNHLAPENDSEHTLLKKHNLPEAKVSEGQWLGKQPAVHAMMDLSDGVDSDLRRILSASNCGAIISLDQFPLSDSLKAASQKFGWDARDLGALGGEDYGLLLTVKAGHYEGISKAFAEKFGTELSSIGVVTANPGELKYKLQGRDFWFARAGFRHFGN